MIDLGSIVSPVALAEAKAWARVERDDETGTLQLLLDAATEAVESELGIALSRRQFRLIAEQRTADGRLCVRKLPVESVDTVLAYGYDGEEVVFDPATSASIPADRVSVQVSDAVWTAGANGVDVTVTAGLLAEEVPAEVKHGILVAATTWLERRSFVDQATVPVLPNAAQRLLRASRRIAL